MHVLAFVNQKGGCGKTTTAVHLSGALAARGERVLLVDLDPQAHATLALGWAIEREPSAIDLMRDRVTVHEAALPAPGGLHLLAATARLAEFEEVAARTLGPERVLRRALERCAWSYDFVLVDCPPRTDGVLAANALRAADLAVLVIECGTFALQGALRAVDVLEEVAGTMERPFDLRAVGTLLDPSTELARETAIGLHAQFGPLLFDTFVRTSERLRECAAAGLPVQALDPAGPAARDFEALAEEVQAWAAASTRELPAPPRAGARPDPLLASRSTPVLEARPRRAAVPGPRS
jgi:chromosome partitioning protein